MFIDNNNKNDSEGSWEVNNDGSQENGGGKKYLIYLGIFIVIIFIGAIVVFLLFKGDKTPTGPTEPGNGGVDSQATSTETGALPISGETDMGNGTTTTLKAEDLAYGQFYEKENIDFDINISKFDFPINIKTDVENYHYINRKIVIDDYVDALNEDGMVIIDNPFKSEADDFYGLYDYLGKEGYPIMITSDFILYLYQNTVKQVFKDIEKDYFYDVFFNTNKKMFDIANLRYRARLSKIGKVNDPLLEGERMEAVFFAVVSELLKPKANQVRADNFLEEELSIYNFETPEYLADQVEKEISLIKGSRGIHKSPTTFNELDYSIFNVPGEYNDSEKLRNFYLASKWFNLVFPIYYKDEGCPDCFIDYDDWVINFIASSLIAKDLSDNENIKDDWAKIYKIVSYFSGLRSDLTYKHYVSAFENNFGEDYNFENIFSNENLEIGEDLRKLQNSLAEFSFNDIEGGYNREDNLVKNILGFRVLSEPYWPDYYLLGQLIDPNVSGYIGKYENNKLDITSCVKGGEHLRCEGFGMDIINLIYSVKNKNDFYSRNTNYYGYEDQLDKLRRKLDDFNMYSWNNNKFWTNLYILKTILNSNIDKPVFTQSSVWEEKEINTALGSWINLQLPADKLEIKSDGQSSGFGSVSGCSAYNYIEPNLELINELKSNSKMIHSMLAALNISQQAQFVESKFDNIDNILLELERIVKKELKGEKLDDKDCKTIFNIANQYEVIQKGEKNIYLKLNSIAESALKSIDGVKLMMVVNKYDDDKGIVLAPIFNFQEK